MFRDRTEAGRRLAERLEPFAGRDPVVYALPRGGVPVAYEIAVALRAPLDLVLVRKIGAPHQPEYGIGAVVDGASPELFLNADALRALGLPPDRGYVAEERDRQLAEIERRRRLYLGDRAAIPATGRTAIVVDDGIATGSTVRVALRALRKAGPARLVLAAPVAPAETVEALRSECDEVVVLDAPEDFGALSMFYEDFHQLDDREVIDLLSRANRPAG